MKAELISVGTELLLGQIVDTNAAYLASELPALGIDCYFVSQVGDNLDRLVDTLRRAAGRSDLVMLTGGLGPTEDDLTREAIAALLGETMVVQPELEAQLRQRFARLSRSMPESNIKQATLIPSATALANPIGTAPGWWVEASQPATGGRCIFAAMPGVPSEMRRMWEYEVKPRLLAAGGRHGHRLPDAQGAGPGRVSRRGQDPPASGLDQSDHRHLCQAGRHPPSADGQGSRQGGGFGADRAGGARDPGDPRVGGLRG